MTEKSPVDQSEMMSSISFSQPVSFSQPARAWTTDSSTQGGLASNGMVTVKLKFHCLNC